MMKYELALVLSAKIEDEERAAMVEKVQAMITTAGAAITNVDEWGKKQLAYEIQKMKVSPSPHFSPPMVSSCPKMG